MDTSESAVAQLVEQAEQQMLLDAQQRQATARRDQERRERARTAQAEADRRAEERAAQVADTSAPDMGHTGLSPSVAGMGFAFQPPPEAEASTPLHQASRRTGITIQFIIFTHFP